jgi:hypothetical protein
MYCHMLYVGICKENIILLTICVLIPKSLHSLVVSSFPSSCSPIGY